MDSLPLSADCLPLESSHREWTRSEAVVVPSSQSSLWRCLRTRKMEMANLPFPLNIPGDKEFQTLCKMLWNWNICAACAKGTQSCHELECAWQQRSYNSRVFSIITKPCPRLTFPNRSSQQLRRWHHTTTCSPSFD